MDHACFEETSHRGLGFGAVMSRAHRNAIALFPAVLFLLAVSLATDGVRAETQVWEDAVALPPDSVTIYINSPDAHERDKGHISGVVRQMLQDRDGHLWFGTQDGIVRHDGASLVYFDLPGAYGSGVTVKAMVEDHHGNIWFGTSGGVTKYDGASFTSFTEDDGLRSNDVWCLCVDRAGFLWIGTLAGVCRFDGKTFSNFDLPNGRANPNRGVSSPTVVWSIMEADDGTLWFAGEGIVCTYDGENVSTVPGMDLESDTLVTSVLQGRAGNIWLASNKGLLRFDGETLVNVSVQHGMLVTKPGELSEDHAGNIWFPVQGSGVYRYDGASFTRFDGDDGLESNAIFSIYEDSARRVWCVGFLAVYRFDGESFVGVTQDGPW